MRRTSNPKSEIRWKIGAFIAGGRGLPPQNRASRDNFPKLADQMDGIAGKFLLSINATDGARETFGRFHVVEVPTTYTVGAGRAKAVSELIVSNFPLAD